MNRFGETRTQFSFSYWIGVTKVFFRSKSASQISPAFQPSMEKLAMPHEYFGNAEVWNRTLGMRAAFPIQ